MASGRRQYPFHLIEPKWQTRWDQDQTFRAWNPGESVPADHPFAQRHANAKPEQLSKFYILDMFPYPSGAGLHVGHPEGYTATDILSRYRRALGFNVLHPIGWDAFGLPAEQYAIRTGQHPRKTTEQNIATFKRQIKSLGFSYDWSREIDTTDPEYFRWTQWIFLQLYNSWFNPTTNKAEPIETLRPIVEEIIENAKANKSQPTQPDPRYELIWNAHQLIGDGKDVATTTRILIDSLRLACVCEAPVWWCEALGTVLANEEVVDGKSEVGGFPVVRKPMRQWMLRITKYADRLLADLDTIEWSDSLKEMQRNWIGRSEGATVRFDIENTGIGTSVYTTRPDTLFGATYLVLAPEHPIVSYICTLPFARRSEIVSYNVEVAKKSDLERTELAKEKTGVFTGAYAINPVNAQKIPIWIADYVLASYGTGAIMAVPAHDERDWEFAAIFGLEIIKVVDTGTSGFANRKPVKLDGKDTNFLFGTGIKVSFRGAGPHKGEWLVFQTYQEAKGFFASRQYDYGEIVPVATTEDGISVNSAGPDISISGLPTPEAKHKITGWLESKQLGQKTINYKLRDWLFSRQRYWGEPFPIIWKTGPDGCAYHEALPESALPLLPPPLDDYKPTPDGQPPLARAKDWVNLPDGSKRETNTMPQWAGSCWYYLRYLDAQNERAMCGPDAEHYWMGAAGDAAMGAPPGTSEDDRRKMLLGQDPSQVKHGTCGVDLYVGGIEHAVLHLLYARFWHKVLFDLGYVSTPEPFYKLVNQGLILGELEFSEFKEKLPDGTEVRVSADELNVTASGGVVLARRKGYRMEDTRPGSGVLIGSKVSEEKVELQGDHHVLREDKQTVVDARSFKMSKSRGNVINPDDILAEYGADAFRLYEMFMGPLEMVKPWSTKGVEGVYRFLGRVWRLFVDEQSETEFEQSLTSEPQRGAELLANIRLAPGIADSKPNAAQLKALHACIKKVSEDLDGLRFNTAISALMVFINEAMTWDAKPFPVLRDFLILLQPFAPHLTEELWAKLHATRNPQPIPSLAYAPWPRFDPALLVEDTLEIPVQVNGKLRDVIKVPADASEADLEAAAKASEKVKPFLDGKTIRKVIVLPKKLVNIVVG